MFSKYEKYFLCIILVAFIIVSVYFIQLSFAYSYDDKEFTLFYENNEEKMAEKIKIYLRNLDDLMIPNSSFDYSDTLVYNYDFLVHFALGYILEYRERYAEKIIIMEPYSYVTREFTEKETNQYISMEEIYRITEQYFGIRDFEFLNEDIHIINHYVSLVQYTEEKFLLDIQDIVVQIHDEFVLAQVYYGYDTCYLYTFVYDNQVLKIRNIELSS